MKEFLIKIHFKKKWNKQYLYNYHFNKKWTMK